MFLMYQKMMVKQVKIIFGSSFIMAITLLIYMLMTVRMQIRMARNVAISFIRMHQMNLGVWLNWNSIM